MKQISREKERRETAFWDPRERETTKSVSGAHVNFEKLHVARKWPPLELDYP